MVDPIGTKPVRWEPAGFPSGDGFLSRNSEACCHQGFLWLAFDVEGWHLAERTKQKLDEVVIDLFEVRLVDLRNSLQQIRQDIQALSAMTAELTNLI